MRGRGGAEAAPARLLLLAAAGSASPGVRSPSEAAADPAAPDRSGRAPAPPRRGGKPGRGARSQSPGQALAHSSLRPGEAGGGGRARAGAAAPRAGRGRLSLLPASSTPPPGASQPLALAAAVDAARNCGPVLGTASVGLGSPEQLRGRQPWARAGEAGATERGRWDAGRLPPRLASGRPRAAECEVRAHAAGPPPRPHPPGSAGASRRCGPGAVTRPRFRTRPASAPTGRRTARGPALCPRLWLGCPGVRARGSEGRGVKVW